MNGPPSFGEAAADRAEEGLRLDSVISAYHLGAQVVLDTLSPMAGPQGGQDVLTLNRVLMQCPQRVTVVGVGGYFQERQAAFGVEILAGAVTKAVQSQQVGRQGWPLDPPIKAPSLTAVHLIGGELRGFGPSAERGRRATVQPSGPLLMR
ncbi:hypothetical protein [Streptomyces sp. ALB3]|uniref:hypothetical protein n=1 Tax=Streptomyces sp. ALB3 TaxID=3374278 RepID=UPI0037B2C2F0